MSAVKHDKGKPMLSLIPRSALWACGDALTYGLHKYGKYNFKAGLEQTRLTDACFRHLTQWLDGQDLDDESGLSHLSHAIASLAMLIDCVRNHPNLDDRYKANDKKTKKSRQVRNRTSKRIATRIKKRKSSIKKGSK